MEYTILELPAKSRPYRPNEKKLDKWMVSCYFIGYSERSKEYKFYDPNTKSIFKSRNAQFFEDVKFARGDKVQELIIELNCLKIDYQINNSYFSLCHIDS